MATVHFSAALLVLTTFTIITLLAASPTTSNTTTTTTTSSPPRLVFPFTVVQPDGGDNRTTTIPAAGNVAFFIARFSLGNPPQPQTVAIDSAGSLTWVYCRGSPDASYEQGMGVNFRPYTSTTYRAVGCLHPACADFNTTCHESACVGSSNFQGEHAYGFLSNDTLRVGGGEGGTEKVVGSFTFGCNYGSPDRLRGLDVDGVLGVGPQKSSSSSSSIASQLGGGGHLLAMCFGALTQDIGDIASYLAVGEGVVLGRNPAPLSFGTGGGGGEEKYHVRVTSVFFGQTRIDDDSAETGVMAYVDTGADAAVLPDPAYELIKGRIMTLLAGVEPMSVGPNNLCYKERPGGAFPSLVFNLEGGSRFELPVESLFTVPANGDDAYFCLWLMRGSFFAGSLDGRSTMVIGVNALQFHNVVFDTGRKLMSVEQIDDCRTTMT